MAEKVDMDSFQEEENLDFLIDDESGADPEPPAEGDDNINDQSDDNVNSGEGGDDNKSTPSDVTSTDNNSQPSAEHLTLFASALAEEGVLSLDEDDKIESFDDLAKVVEKTIRQNELAGLTPTQREYLKAIENGITHNEFVQTQQKIADVSNIKEETVKENEDLQKQLIAEDFISKGYSKEKAEKLAQRSFDLGENEADALEALKAKQESVLKEKEALEKQRAEDLKNQEKQVKETLEKVKKQVFDEKSEVIPGFKFNKKVAEEVYKSMTQPIDYAENGQPISRSQKLRMDNPIDFEHKLNYLLVMTKDFTDFSAFDNTNKTKKSKQFLDKLTDSSSSGGAGGFVNLGDTDDLDWIANNL